MSFQRLLVSHLRTPLLRLTFKQAKSLKPGVAWHGSSEIAERIWNRVLLRLALYVDDEAMVDFECNVFGFGPILPIIHNRG